MKNDQEYIEVELEALTGKIYRGDLTTVVFDVLKESPHLESLLMQLNKEKKVNVNNNKSDTVVRKESNYRPNFKQLIANGKKL